jgi:hypothetical protein
MKKHIGLAWALTTILLGGPIAFLPASAHADGGDGKANAKAKAKADHADRQKERDKDPGDRADKREARQAKRIEHGIKKGALTPDEVDKLTKQQQNIAGLEDSLKGDGKVSKDDAKQLKDALDTASRNIWGEKHDTDGKQLATYRLGDNVFAKDDFTKKMADPNLSKEDARKLTHDFHHIVGLKRSLATDDLTAEQRAKKQAEFDDLLNQYFEVRGK